jgi:hypothetical protein
VLRSLGEILERNLPKRLSRFDRILIGGERGIRTLGRVSPTHAFQACSFNHSDISPFRINKLRAASHSVAQNPPSNLADPRCNLPSAVYGRADVSPASKLCQTSLCAAITYGDFVELLVRDDSMCTDHLRPPLSPIPASCLAAGEELRVRASVHANVPASRPRESTVRRNEIVRGTTRHDNGADTDRRAHRRCVVRPSGGCRFLLPMSIARRVRDPA